ncbi:MAG TPA: hypothetical protein VM938_11885 [Acidimicrobiales bacterium]|nr:hypothetical protein [Acidimicrobiales bacterium]
MVQLRFTGVAEMSPGLVIDNSRHVSGAMYSSACVNVTAGLKKSAGAGPCAFSVSWTASGTCAYFTGFGTGRMTTHDGHVYVAAVSLVGVDGKVEMVFDPVTKQSTGQIGTGVGVATLRAKDHTGGDLACLNAAGASRYDVLNGQVTLAVG